MIVSVEEITPLKMISIILEDPTRSDEEKLRDIENIIKDSK